MPGVQAVIDRVRAACLAAGRDPSEVTIVAAAKTRTNDEIQAVVDAGITDIGENRVQEFLEKSDVVTGARWHLIGHLQSNKINKVVGQVALIHSIDSLDLAERIAARARTLGIIQPILIEVNISGEATKHGFLAEQVPEAVARLAELDGLDVLGFMAMPAPNDDAAERFRQVRELRDSVRTARLPLSELSIGMSGDLEAAIAEGATLVRPGTALFGPRE
jgi:PLP dependent protein